MGSAYGIYRAVKTNATWFEIYLPHLTSDAATKILVVELEREKLVTCRLASCRSHSTHWQAIVLRFWNSCNICTVCTLEEAA